MLELQDAGKTFKDVAAVDGVPLRLESGLIGLVGHDSAHLARKPETTIHRERERTNR